MTLAAYFCGRQVQFACGGSPLVNPVLIAIALVAFVVLATNTNGIEV